MQKFKIDKVQNNKLDEIKKTNCTTVKVFIESKVSKLHVIGYDGDALGVDGVQIGVFKQTNKVSVATFHALSAICITQDFTVEVKLKRLFQHSIYESLDKFKISHTFNSRMS